MMADEAAYHTLVGREFEEHGIVHHNKGGYGRCDTHTNTIEGSFSIFNHRMKGEYQHCGKQHLHRYLSEFDFRYSERNVSDTDRAERLLSGIAGRRLMYRDSSEWPMFQ